MIKKTVIMSLFLVSSAIFSSSIKDQKKCVKRLQDKCFKASQKKAELEMLQKKHFGVLQKRVEFGILQKKLERVQSGWNMLEQQVCDLEEQGVLTAQDCCEIYGNQPANSYVSKINSCQLFAEASFPFPGQKIHDVSFIGIVLMHFKGQINTFAENFKSIESKFEEIASRVKV